MQYIVVGVRPCASDDNNLKAFVLPAVVTHAPCEVLLSRLASCRHAYSRPQIAAQHCSMQ
eukprot:823397-Pleurochrysis_carterae.AAC.1